MEDKLNTVLQQLQIPPMRSDLKEDILSQTRSVSHAHQHPRYWKFAMAASVVVMIVGVSMWLQSRSTTRTEPPTGTVLALQYEEDYPSYELPSEEELDLVEFDYVMQAAYHGEE
jgi:hypothetical protein